MRAMTQWLLPATASLMILAALPAYSNPFNELQINEADIITNIIEPCIVQRSRNNGLTEDMYTDSQLIATITLAMGDKITVMAHTLLFLAEISMHKEFPKFGDANTPGEMEAAVNRFYAFKLQKCLDP